MSRQCPRCGVSDAEARFIGNFCEPCHADMNLTSLPHRIIVYACKDCGACRYGKQWRVDLLEVSRDIAFSLRDKRLGIPIVKIFEDDGYASVKYDAIDRMFRIPFRIKQSLCEICSQKLSGYYEAIIQLRGGYSDNAFVEKLLRSLEKHTFITKIVELNEGIDVYCGDKKVVSSLLSAMKLKPKTSYSLYGIKKGRKVYRTTFLLKK